MFYIMILTLFSMMRRLGYAGEAEAVCEVLYSSLSWIVPVSEGMMLPVFLYWFYLQISGKTVFPRLTALKNVIVIFGILKMISLLMPVSAFRLGFTNGLMSESMLIWFGIMAVWEMRKGREKNNT